MMSMDLDVYPPPDLAIDADITSKMTLEAYAGIQVPEVWIYNNSKSLADRPLSFYFLIEQFRLNLLTR